MKLHVYSIYDSAAKAYMRPFFQANDGLAIRAFQAIVNGKEENDITMYPDQFSLHKIGEFCDDKGVLTPSTSVSLGLAATYKLDKDRSDSGENGEGLRQIKDLVQEIYQVIIGKRDRS